MGKKAASILRGYFLWRYERDEIWVGAGVVNSQEGTMSSESETSVTSGAKHGQSGEWRTERGEGEDGRMAVGAEVNIPCLGTSIPLSHTTQRHLLKLVIPINSRRRKGIFGQRTKPRTG